MVKASITRAFRSLKSLLAATPLYCNYESELNKGISMMDSAVPAAKEYLKYCLSQPSCILDVHNIKDMIEREKVTFNGTPTKIMIYRWGYTLKGLLNYLNSIKRGNSDLSKEIESFCLQILEMK